MNTLFRFWILSLFCVLFFSPSYVLLAEDVPQTQEQKDLMEENHVTTPNFHALFFKTMFLVGGILIAATAGLYLLKKAQNRFINGKGEADILLLERHSLSPKTQVFLLSVKGKEMIVVESAHQISVSLTTITKELDDKEII